MFYDLIELNFMLLLHFILIKQNSIIEYIKMQI